MFALRMKLQIKKHNFVFFTVLKHLFKLIITLLFSSYSDHNNA